MILTVHGIVMPAEHVHGAGNGAMHLSRCTFGGTYRIAYTCCGTVVLKAASASIRRLQTMGRPAVLPPSAPPQVMMSIDGLIASDYVLHSCI